MRKLTLIEVLALIVVAVAVLAIFFPQPGGTSAASLEVRESQHLRGIHQGFLIYAEDNGSYFPGLDSKGRALDLSVESRLTPLVTRKYLLSDYFVSLKETDPSIRAWSGKGQLSVQNFSYTMLQIPDAGGRREEWRSTTNAKAMLLADRNTGNDPRSPRSLWSREGGRGEATLSSMTAVQHFSPPTASTCNTATPTHPTTTSSPRRGTATRT